jgi:hypothetical protein
MTKLVGRGHVVPNQADRARICVVQEIQTVRTPRSLRLTDDVRYPGDLSGELTGHRLAGCFYVQGIPV